MIKGIITKLNTNCVNRKIIEILKIEWFRSCKKSNFSQPRAVRAKVS